MVFNLIILSKRGPVHTNAMKRHNRGNCNTDKVLVEEIILFILMIVIVIKYKDQMT